MANIKKIENKSGTSYQITVTSGRDSTGKQKRYWMTWTPAVGMTQRQIDKELTKQSVEFENQIVQGFIVDNKQTFFKYAEYVIDLKERNGAKHRTIESYKYLMLRINKAIGHIKLADLRPQHLNTFYKNLSENGIRDVPSKANTKVDLLKLIKSKGLTQKAVFEEAGIAPMTLSVACQGKKIAFTKAEAIAKALKMNVSDLFNVEKDKTPLSNKTITEYHRLISTVLDQAEKEMLVQYNVAKKSTPPKLAQKEVNYFQPEDIARIIECLENEPIKWRTITHLLLITGCRRGEIMGLKWSKVDFSNSQIKVDSSLLYARDIGIYEGPTKTSKTRFVKLPQETMQLLKQYRAWYFELQLVNGDQWKNSDFVFVQSDGSPMSPDSITSWLGDFSKRHELPHINPHAFRHTMASVLINSGKDVVAVSKRLGHAKVSTTTDIYSHIIKQADEQASDCLADVMLRSKKA